METGHGNTFQSSYGCRHRKYLRIVGSAVQHSSSGKQFHEILGTGYRCHLKPVCHGFRECCQMRCYIEILLSSAGCEPKTCDRLVEDQKCTIFFASLFSASKISISWSNCARITHCRFHKNSCNIALSQSCLE